MSWVPTPPEQLFFHWENGTFKFVVLPCFDLRISLTVSMNQEDRCGGDGGHGCTHLLKFPLVCNAVESCALLSVGCLFSLRTASALP